MRASTDNASAIAPAETQARDQEAFGLLLGIDLDAIEPGLDRLARLDADVRPGFDRAHLTGSRIGCGPRLVLPGLECPEAARLDPVAIHQRLDDPIEDRRREHFGLVRERMPRPGRDRGNRSDRVMRTRF